MGVMNITYGALAQKYKLGLVLESPTWRASADWGQRQGYGAAELADVNRRAIALLQITRSFYSTNDFRGLLRHRAETY